MTAPARTAEAVQAWLAAADLPWEAGARPGEYVVQLPGEAKLRTTVAFLAGRHAVTARAFVVRRPDENAEDVLRWLLQRNLRLPGIAFAVDHLGDVYLVGRLPAEAATPQAIDELAGALLTTADGAFNELLRLGFATAIRREWRWRLDRGEPTANLEAFGSLRPDQPDAEEPDADGAAPGTAR